MNKLQWNLNRNSNIFIQENAFESVFWEMAAMLSQPQCVNPVSAGPVYIRNPNFVTNVPADGPAPNGARPSAGTVLNEALDMFIMPWIGVYHGEMDVIQRRDKFFHITSGRITMWRRVNQLKELFFLNLFFFF